MHYHDRWCNSYSHMFDSAVDDVAKVAEVSKHRYRFPVILPPRNCCVNPLIRIHVARRSLLTVLCQRELCPTMQLCLVLIDGWFSLLRILVDAMWEAVICTRHHGSQT